MGKLFNKCANCSQTILGGVKEGELRFCSKQCRNFHAHPGYCDQCAHETLQEGMGGTYTVNVLFGTRLMAWGSERCPRCHSRVMRKWFWFFLPLFPVSAQYRVLHQSPKLFLSRKLRIS